MTLKVDGRFGASGVGGPTKTVMNGGARGTRRIERWGHLGNEELARDARASGHNKGRSYLPLLATAATAGRNEPPIGDTARATPEL